MALQELKYVPLELLDFYVRSLYRRPALTKSITSGLIAGFGDVLFQLTKSELQSEDAQANKINWQSVAAYAGSGLFVTGPLAHYFYKYLDTVIPSNGRWSSIKRIIVERIIFGPVYLMIVLYVRNRFLGLSHREARKKLYRTYWQILKMSYRVWTIAQYININHVPQQYRVLFINVVSLGWNIYLASQGAKRKQH
ncbi:peroxisomal membrane protein 2 [Chamberlinius hualienensis]